MSHSYQHESVPDADRRELLKVLGVAGTVAVGGVTLDELQNDVAVADTAELEETGEAIQNALAGSLDAVLLEEGATGLQHSLEQIPELAAAGLPAERGSAYEELAEPGWNVNNHLVDIGFYEVAERELPMFTAERIEATMQTLVASGTLSETLAGVGFSNEAQMAFASDVVTNKDYLAHWVPAEFYGEEHTDDFLPENVAPLHQRSMEGSLLWIDSLDQKLWQNRVLIPDNRFQRGIADVQAMLGGMYLMTIATQQLAADNIGDAELSALITASSAAMIANQKAVADDLFRITDSERAPQGGDV